MQSRIVPVTGVTWTSQSRFRFRCDASANDDQVYIDDIYIRSCQNFPAMQEPEVIVPPAVSNDRPEYYDPESVTLSPNPVSEELHLAGIPFDEANITVFNASGSMMPNVLSNRNTLDVSQLPPGLYFIRIEKDGQLILKRFIKN